MSDEVAQLTVCAEAPPREGGALVGGTDGAAPQWQRVPFDVGCARCGRDLRGLTEPVCPACGLTFDWADAVPLEELVCEVCGYHLCGLTETRCPECATGFTWADALAARERRRRPTFEYHWRSRFIRSYAKSLLLALRPRRLWKQVDIYDRPAVGALFGLAIVSLMLTLLIGVVVPTLVTWATWGTSVRTPSGQWVVVHFQLAALWWSFVYVLNDGPMIVGGLLAWCGASLLALMVFRQSMRRCKVRTGHVIRVWAYTVPVLLPMLWTALAVWFALEQVLREWFRGPAWAFPLFAVFARWASVATAVCFLAHVVWSIRCGYAHYLRMRHAFWVAVSAQAMAILATQIVVLSLR